MTVAALQSYDAAIKLDNATGAGSGYCIYDTVGGFQYFKSGPAGDITQDSDASGDCTA